MKALDLKTFHAQSPGVSAPWKVTEVSFDGDHSLVMITVECAAGVVRAEPGSRLTRAIEEQVIELLQGCRTVRGAARGEVLTDDAVDGVIRRAVRRGLQRREESFPARFGLDEPERSGDRLPQAARRLSAANHKSILKGHRHATLPVDLDKGCVIELADGRTIEVAAGLLRGLSETARISIEAIAMDMSPANISAAREVLPAAAIVSDRFHVAMHINAAVDEVGRTGHRKLSSSGDSGLRSSKHFGLRLCIDLRTRGAAEFRALLARELQTGTAWTLKEKFRYFRKYRRPGRAMKLVPAWVDAVRSSGLKPLTEAAGDRHEARRRDPQLSQAPHKQRDERGAHFHGAEPEA